MLQDIRFGLRLLRRNLGLSAIAILSLTLVRLLDPKTGRLLREHVRRLTVA